MLLSNKRDYDLRMQVPDSVRYREAVTRLKRILYDQPSGFELSKKKSPILERKNLSEPPPNKEEYEREFSDNALDDGQKSFSSLFDVVKKQEDLITQLEKENFFLKNELVSTAEASKEVALQNESFRKRLTETLIQMETSPDISSFSDGNEKMEEIIASLKEEREKLVECIKLQEDTIASLRQRDVEAIDKVKQAVGLAEDSQRLTNKVRESSDQNRKDLQQQLGDALNKLQYLHTQLQRAQEREKEQDMLLRDQETSLSKLEEDKREKDLSLRKRELDCQNQIEDLKRNLKEAEEGKARLEKMVREQRNTSEATFKRLEALLDRRNLEAEAFANKRKFLEQQIWDLKHENEKLLQAINDLAKERSSHTDDVKYAKQMSSLLFPENMDETQKEISEIKSTVQQHQDSILHLQEEVSAVRQEMTQEIEGLRENFEDLYSSVNKDNAAADPLTRLAVSKGKENVTSGPDIDMTAISSNSERYDSVKEFTVKPSKRSPPKCEENDFPKKEKDKIISILFPRKIKNNGKLKVVETDLRRKEIDETESDSTLSYDEESSRKIVSSNERIKVKKEEQEKSKVSEDPLLSDKIEENAGTKHEPSEDGYNLSILKEANNLTKDEFEKEEVGSEISPKEFKTNADDEKDKDECSTHDDLQSNQEESKFENSIQITSDACKDDSEEKDVDKATPSKDLLDKTLTTGEPLDIQNIPTEDSQNDKTVSSLHPIEILDSAVSEERTRDQEEIVVQAAFSEDVEKRSKVDLQEVNNSGEVRCNNEERNLCASKESNVDVSEENKEVSSKEKKEVSSKEKKEVSSKERKEVSSEENKEVSSKEKKEVFSKEKKEVSSDSSVSAQKENDEDAYRENKSDSTGNVLKGRNVDTSSESNVDTFNETKIDAMNKSDVEVSKVDTIKTSADRITTDSDVTLPVMEAVVQVINNEMEEIKDEMELQSRRIDSIAHKVLALPEATHPPDPPSSEELAENNRVEKVEDDSVE